MRLFLLVVSLSCVLSSLPARGEECRPPPAPGTVELVGRVPAPGFPEGVAVWGSHAYVASPATFGTAGMGPSRIFVYHLRTGRLEREIVIQGQDLSQEHALSELAFDRQGRLYVIETQQGVLRMDRRGRRQEVYAPALPDLRPCQGQPPGAPCSPTGVDLPPLPNGLAFDHAGNLYVTDSLQATLFRIPPGGGAPQVWYQDERLDTGFGPNGVRVGPEGRSLYFSVTGPVLGAVYKLPLVERPGPADLEAVAVLPLSGPDGIAFGEDGRLYVALALTSQVAVLGPQGEELARVPTPEANAQAEVPVSGPAILAFDEARRALLVTNHLPADPSHFALLRVLVGDRGLPLPRPHIGR